MSFQFGRIKLVPETRVHREPVFDVVFIGHTDKDADLAKLFANSSMLNDMHAAGYTSILDHLWNRHSVANIKQQGLYNLPVPIRSLDEFQQLFVHTKEKTQDRYKSRLGGDYTWLPLAVADFFQTEVMQIPRRLWIIPVDENQGVDAFLTSDIVPAVEEDHALLRALALPDAGLICLPDFERLHISQSLKHIPLLRVVNPLPAFLPCGTSSDDGITERSGVIKEKPDQSIHFIAHLKRILTLIAKYRRDINVLMAFPYDQKMDGELPRTSVKGETQLKQWRQESDRQLLRHVQLIYPYLQDSQSKLSSPCGILAGKILSSTTTNGSWRSIAGIDLPSLKRPFPNLSIKIVNSLRDDVGLAVINQQTNHMQLDDERLSVAYVDDQAATNSGELARFMGWLIRSLEKLGLNMVFESQADALKIEILLRNFFGRLYEMGALRGKKTEDAFSVKSRIGGEGCVIVDIEIAPALPIDQLILNFRLENGEFRAGGIKNG